MAADKVDPIHQFNINTLIPIHVGGYDISFTNSSLLMVVAAVLAGRIEAKGPTMLLLSGANIDMDLHYRLISGEDVDLMAEG